MADELGSASDQTTQQAVGKATAKKFVSPSIDIVKTVQGIVELVLRGVGTVSNLFL